MFIMRLYTIKYCIFQVNRLINKSTCKISAEDESIDSKYTVFNCVKSHYAHFVWNYFNFKQYNSFGEKNTMKKKTPLEAKFLTKYSSLTIS